MFNINKFSVTYTRVRDQFGYLISIQVLFFIEPCSMILDFGARDYVSVQCLELESRTIDPSKSLFCVAP